LPTAHPQRLRRCDAIACLDDDNDLPFVRKQLCKQLMTVPAPTMTTSSGFDR
jgi:hypothetical protein